jgi:hypothetical protein
MSTVEYATSNFILIEKESRYYITCNNKGELRLTNPTKRGYPSGLLRFTHLEDAKGFLDIERPSPLADFIIREIKT